LAGRSDECTLASCAEACRLNGVEWVERDGLGLPALETGLNVIGQFLPNDIRDMLLKRTCGGAAAFALICSPEWTPLRRVLLFNDARRADGTYLRRAAGACSVFDAAAVVLTIAPSEEDAQRGQQFARNVLEAEGVSADYDYAAACDLHTAIQVEATCRRCSHVFINGATVSPPRRWGLGAGQPLTSHLSRSLTLLTFPEQPATAAHGWLPARQARNIEVTQ
jgi:hypothetical protein